MALSATRWSKIALLLALAAGGVLATIVISDPGNSCQGFATATSSGTYVSVEECHWSTGSWLENKGAGVLLVFLPALVAAVPVVLGGRRSTIAAAVALTAWALLWTPSIGLFYLPTVVLAWLAATAERSRPATSPSAADSSRQEAVTPCPEDFPN